MTCSIFYGDNANYIDGQKPLREQGKLKVVKLFLFTINKGEKFEF